MSPETSLNLTGKSEKVCHKVLSMFFRIRKGINNRYLENIYCKTVYLFSLYEAAERIFIDNTFLICKWPVSTRFISPIYFHLSHMFVCQRNILVSLETCLNLKWKSEEVCHKVHEAS